MRTTVVAVLCGLLMASPAMALEVLLDLVPLSLGTEWDSTPGARGFFPEVSPVELQLNAIILDAGIPTGAADGIGRIQMDLVADTGPGTDLGAVSLIVPYERGQFNSAGTGGDNAITGIQPSAAGFGITPPPPTVAPGEPVGLFTVAIPVVPLDQKPPYEVIIQNIQALGALYSAGPVRLNHDMTGQDAAAAVTGGRAFLGVPEPATLAILAMGSGLVWLRRRR